MLILDKIKTGELYTKGSITYTFENLPAGLHDAKFVSGADSYTKEVEMLKVTLIFVDENDIDVQDIADNTITVVVKNYKGVITESNVVLQAEVHRFLDMPFCSSVQN